MTALWAVFLAASPALAEFRPEIYGLIGKERETGIKLGRGRFHLALGALNTYDSNALYTETDEKPDYVFQLIPGGDLVWNSRRFSLTSGYRFTYRKNQNETIQSSNAHVANLESHYKASRRISLGVIERFERTSDPADVQLPERLQRYTNEASGEVKYTTPGEDFETAVRYTHTYQKYHGALAALSFYNNKVILTSRINVSSSFRFLPKSVANVRVEYGQTNFRQDISSPLTNTDSRGVTGSVGLTSQVTRKLGLSVDVGGSSIFFDTGPNALAVTGGGSVSYHPSAAVSFTGGYHRTVQVATFTNFYSDHRFTFDALWKFARRFEYYLKTEYDFLDFSGPTILPNAAERRDFLVQILSGVSFSFTEWCKARVEYGLDLRDSNATDPFGVASASFTKHRANLGIDFYY
jgi:hypothetical protein